MNLIFHEISSCDKPGKDEGKLFYILSNQTELIKDLFLDINYTADHLYLILKSRAIGYKGLEKMKQIKEYLKENLETQLKSQKNYIEITESREK